MRQLFALALAVTLSGCAWGGLWPDSHIGERQAVSPAITDAANQRFIACLMDATHRLDDGRSDPSSVALGVEGACAGQFQQSLYAQESGMSDAVRIRFEQKARQHEIEISTQVVLGERKKS